MEVKVNKGVVTLRLPNYIESWRMRSFVGTPDPGFEYAAWAVARLAQFIVDNPSLVDLSRVAGCNSFSEFIDDPKNSTDVTIILGKFSSRLSEFSWEKKN